MRHTPAFPQCHTNQEKTWPLHILKVCEYDGSGISTKDKFRLCQQVKLIDPPSMHFFYQEVFRLHQQSSLLDPLKRFKVLS